MLRFVCLIDIQPGRGMCAVPGASAGAPCGLQSERASEICGPLMLDHWVFGTPWLDSS